MSLIAFLGALLIILAIFYYIWLYFIELNKVESSTLPLLKQCFKDKLFLRKTASPKCICIQDLTFDSCHRLKLEIFQLGRDSISTQDTSQIKFFFKDEILFKHIDLESLTFRGGRTYELMVSIIYEFLQKACYDELPSDTIDYKVCKIIFENYPEALWADNSQAEIKKVLQTLSLAYNASMNNELLAFNKKTMARSIKLLLDESTQLENYSNEIWDSIRKCYEFLSVPANLKSFGNYDTKIMELYARNPEIRRNFAEIIAIKNEYDNLLS